MSDRPSIMSWPSILVLALASVGILTTAPLLETQRPRSDIQPFVLEAGAGAIPARLWQDPLAAAYQFEADNQGADGKLKQGVASIQQVIDEQLRPGRPQEILFLSVLMPGSTYPEDSEQCRRRRYAVVSALGRARFVPQHSDTIGLLQVRFEDQDAEAATDSPLLEARQTSVPFEWYGRELKDGSRDPDKSVFVHWIDEGRLGESPLASLAAIHHEFQAAVAGRAASKHAMIGPASSTTLLQMWQDRDAWARAESPPATIYSTQATSPGVRQKTTGRTRQRVDVTGNLKLWHLIGTDQALAQDIVRELKLRSRSPDGDNEIAVLIGERDTVYGRDMLNTFRAAFGNAHDEGDENWNVQQIEYLRGLDGVIPNAKGATQATQGESSAAGQTQVDYVRRFVRQLKQQPKTVRAIGVLGSDVYDKLLLLRALRNEFRTAAIFTTDLDDRLLQRSEYSWTHNLIVDSHYDLALCGELQGAVPPFRSSYQTSLFLGTLMMLKDQAFLNDNMIPGIQKAADKLTQENVDSLVFEVGRSGGYNLTQVANDPCDLKHADGIVIHPKGSRIVRWLRINKPLAVVVCLLCLAGFLFSFRGPVRRFVGSLVRLKFGWRHYLAFVIVGLTIIFWAVIRYDHFNALGEPFALYDGISVWPSVCLRLLLIVFCVYAVLRASEQLQQSYTDVSKRVLEIEVNAPSRRLSSFDKFRSALRTLLSPRQLWSTAGANSIAAFSEPQDEQPENEEPGDALCEWNRYQQWGQFGRRHVRLIGHLVLLVALVGMLFVIFGMAGTPARGAVSRPINLVIFVVSGIAILWLMLFVLDAIRLCNQFVSLVASDKTHWPDNVLRNLSQRYATSDRAAIRGILDQMLNLRLVAEHTNIVSKLVYLPALALLIWFVARHPIFDNWSWAPQYSLTCGVLLAITFYSATILGKSANSAKQRALQSIGDVINSLEWDSSERKQAEALLKETQEIQGGAMVPLRKNPVIAAALVPFGSLSSVYVLDLVLQHVR